MNAIIFGSSKLNYEIRNLQVKPFLVGFKKDPEDLCSSLYLTEVNCSFHILSNVLRDNPCVAEGSGTRTGWKSISASAIEYEIVSIMEMLG